MGRPVIGLTAYHEPARWRAWEAGAVLLHDWYVSAFTRAGAAPVLLPPLPEQADDVLGSIDGLVLTGGPDVDPARYGQLALPTTDEPRTSRDESELQLYVDAKQRGLPVFGICRGLQIMAVAEGGTLVQHLPDVATSKHRDQPGSFLDHDVTFAPGSLAHALLGERATVASSHHQGIASPGRLTPTGWAPDGTIEACENPDAHAFLLGVQWHPEAQDDPRLFNAFVAACAHSRRSSLSRPRHVP